MSPPRLAARWLERLLPPDVAESVLGDLEEDFEARRLRRGMTNAQRWYWRQILLLILHRRRLIQTPVPQPESRGNTAVSAFYSDLRQALKLLARRPGFTLLSVLILGLGLGTATGTFSIVNGVLLRPLPYPSPDRIVRIYETAPEAQGAGLRSIAIPTLHVWEKELRSFEQVALYGPTSFDLTSGDRPVRLNGVAVSRSFFAVMGVQPMIGRSFTAEEDRPGGALTIILSHRLWMDRFGGDRAVIGQSLRLDRAQFTVIGVMPPDFSYPARPDFWASLATDHEYDAVSARHMGGIGRLKAGQTVATAAADLLRVEELMARENPKSYANYGVRLIPLQERLVGEVRPALRILAGAVGLVLLIACVNAANLLLARSAARRREMALRLALGAKRSRLVRQLVLESVVLFGLAGTVGLGLATLIVRGARGVGNNILPLADLIRLDWPVVMFALALAALTGLASGLFPALQASAAAPRAALGDGSRSGSGPRTHRARAVLIVAETGLTAMLLVAAGLLLRSMQRLNAVDPGFPTERMLIFTVSLPSGENREAVAIVSAFDRIRERIEAIAEVESVALGSRLPLSGEDHSNSFFLAGVPGDPANALSAQDRAVSAGYFRAMGIPVLRGREFTSNDGAGAPPVAVINQAFAERYFPGVDPIGQRFRPTRAGNLEREVVGVVGNARQFGLDVPAEPEFYLSHGQDAWPFMNFAVRTSIEPRRLIAQVEEAVWSIDPELPLAEVRTMDEMTAESGARRRLAAICLTAFAVMAYILAAAGLYGVIAHAVTQRTPEIGIRMALGASARGVARMVVQQGLRLVTLGAAIGLVLAIPFSQALRGLLFGVTGTDPITYLAIALLLPGVGLIAVLVPARRAMRTDPAIVMRED